VRYALAPLQLGLGSADVLREFSPVEEPLILVNVHQDRRPASVLSEDKWAAGLPDVSNESSRVGTELGKRLDILTQARRSGHRGSMYLNGKSAYMIMYNITYGTVNSRRPEA
jgi:hypothetical protein